MTKRIYLFLLIVFLVGACMMYAPTLNFGFIFDDLPVIRDNPSLRLWDWQDFVGVHGRWVTYLFNWSTIKWFGATPWVFRVQNCIMHLASALLVYLLFSLLFGNVDEFHWIGRHSRSVPFLAAALFLFHPVQTQTIFYITQMRLEGLMVFLMLLTLYCLSHAMIRWKQQHAWWWLFVGIVVGVCAAGTKEAVVVLPILAWIIDWFFVAQGDIKNWLERWQLHAFFGGVFWGVYFILNRSLPLGVILSCTSSVLCNRGNLLTATYDTPISAYHYLLTQIPIGLHYFFIFFYPFNLGFDYDISIITRWDHHLVILASFAFTCILCTALGLWIQHRTNVFSFGITWFCVTMLPRTTIIPSSELVTDYKTFAASIGMMILLAAGLCWLWEYGQSLVPSKYQTLGDALLCILAIIGFVRLLDVTIKRRDLWGNQVAFWTDVVKHTPKRPRALNNLGVALMENGQTELGVRYLIAAADMDSQYAEPLINLGSHYHCHKEYAKARAYYARAEQITREPHAELFVKKGLLNVHDKHFDLAERDFKRAIMLNGACSNAWYCYAELLYNGQRYSEAYEAITQCEKYHQNPRHEQILLLKARTAYNLERYCEVVDALEDVIESCDSMDIWFMLAGAYYDLEDYKRAALWFKKIYTKQPDNLNVAYNYAQSLMHLERYAAAVPLFEQCASSSEQYPFAQVHQAACLYKNGNRNAALLAVNKLGDKELPTAVFAELTQLKNQMGLLA